MRSDRLHSLLGARGPFVSIYLDDSHNTADAAAQLKARWRDLYKHLENENVDPTTISRLEVAVLDHRPAVGRRGRIIVATREQTLLNEQLTTPPPATVLRISAYPFVVPLIEFSSQRPTYVVAAVDREGAGVALHQGDTVRTHIVEGGGYPVHKSPAAENDYSHPQLRTEEAIRHNIRAVADNLIEVVEQSDPEVIFISGEVRSRTDVVSALPQRVAARVCQLNAGVYSREIDDKAVADAIEAEFGRHREAEIARLTDRFLAERGRHKGLAAEGIPAVCAALRERNVETLLLGELSEATVIAAEDRATVAPNPDVLSEWGQAATLVARADEALPFAAIAVGASLAKIHGEMSPADGIAAILRYPSTD